MPFIPSIVPPTVAAPAWWHIFHHDQLLMCSEQERVHLPYIVNLQELGLTPLRTQYLGALDGVPCFVAEIEPPNITLPEQMTFQGLRALFDVFPEELFRLAGRAFHIMDWDRTHQYCGKCGTPTTTSATERAKVCPTCGLTAYPRISPAVIVAVIKDRDILLAHSKRFVNDMYSVLAGFVEPGETFEDCVHREIREEVGIDVTDIRYFGSQPWPFPNSLMVGFTARYAGGEITVDGVEINDAAWFSASRLPRIPGKISISRALIDWFIETYK